VRLHQRGFVGAVSEREPAAFDHYPRKGLSTIGKKSPKSDYYAFALTMENGFCDAATPHGGSFAESQAASFKTDLSVLPKKRSLATTIMPLGSPTPALRPPPSE